MYNPNSGLTGAFAFRQAVEDAGAFVDQQMRSFGWMSPGADGKYSILSSQEAFDPDRVIQFDESGAPRVDAQGLAQAASQGQYGTQGLFAQTAQAGASREADIALGERIRGFGRGSGLSAQRRRTAENLSTENMGQLSSKFLQGLVGQYQRVGGAYQNALAAQAQGAASSAQRLAGYTSFYNN
jgi:hypothetical protein